MRGSVILASSSAARARLLRRAGINPKIRPPHVDEEGLKAALRDEGAQPEQVAEALAEAKAVKVSLMEPSALVLGADQVLDIEGALLDKPGTRARAEAQLRHLAGKTHRLITAQIIARGGEALWRLISVARLTMRALSDNEITAYLDAAGPDILTCVGGYQIEDLGVQLFDAVEGDHFVIQGLDLIATLRQLRLLGAAP